jgi:cytosine/adenosine deaminase-related metal-dependent hydrolase
MVGAHASFTLSERSLTDCAELMAAFDAGLHIHVAEDRFDVEHARARYGEGLVERLARHGVLNDRTILAHGVHLDDREIKLWRETGSWLAHNPRSNLNNRVGYAPVAKFGDGLVIGTDGIGADMFEEARFAFLKGQEQKTGLSAGDWLRALARNQRLASQTFGIDLCSLWPGAAADLLILDYDPPTPITAENLAWHFMLGLSSAHVESVMVDGEFIIRDRQTMIDQHEVACRARKAGEKLWAKLR